MITIKKTKLPSYLQNSELANQFEDEITIPEKYLIKEIKEITTIEQFNKIVNILKYWMINQYPKEVLIYILENNVDVEYLKEPKLQNHYNAISKKIDSFGFPGKIILNLLKLFNLSCEETTLANSFMLHYILEYLNDESSKTWTPNNINIFTISSEVIIFFEKLIKHGRYYPKTKKSFMKFFKDNEKRYDPLPKDDYYEKDEWTSEDEKWFDQADADYYYEEQYIRSFPIHCYNFDKNKELIDQLASDLCKVDFTKIISNRTNSTNSSTTFNEFSNSDTGKKLRIRKISGSITSHYGTFEMDILKIAFSGNSLLNLDKAILEQILTKKCIFTCKREFNVTQMVKYVNRGFDLDIKIPRDHNDCCKYIVLSQTTIYCMKEPDDKVLEDIPEFIESKQCPHCGMYLCPIWNYSRQHNGKLSKFQVKIKQRLS